MTPPFGSIGPSPDDRNPGKPGFRQKLNIGPSPDDHPTYSTTEYTDYTETQEFD